MCSAVNGILLALVVAGLAYYLWIPLPDDLDQKWFVRSSNVIIKLMRLLEWTGPVFLGHTNQYQFRRGFAFFLQNPLALDADPELQVTNEVFGNIPVRVRVYRPKSAPVPTPVLMNFHGGGWAVGSIDMDEGISRYLAKQADVAVVSVEYRLAPEHPFPAGLDDCVAATAHVLKHGLHIGLDPNKVGVTGLSAGGNLAAAVSLRLQDAEFHWLPQLKYQIPIAPVLQAVDLNLPSYVDNDHVLGALLSRKDAAEFILAYAGLDISPSAIKQVSLGLHIRDEVRSTLEKYIPRGNPTDKKSTDKEIDESRNQTLTMLAEPILLNYLLSPLVAPDNLLKNVPRALLVISHYDILRDDAVFYLKRLRENGVKATSHMIANGQHASMFFSGSQPGSDVTIEAYQKIVTFIKDSNAS